MYLRIITAIILSLAAATATSSVPLNKRIVNGTPVKEGELPALATGAKDILHGDSFIGGCGGVLIGPQTVLTGK